MGLPQGAAGRWNSSRPAKRRGKFTLHPLSRQMLQEVFPTAPRREVYCHTTPTGLPRHDRGPRRPCRTGVHHLTGGKHRPVGKKLGGGYSVYDPATKKELVPSEPVRLEGGHRRPGPARDCGAFAFFAPGSQRLWGASTAGLSPRFRAARRGQVIHELR